jgi:hypothetical protein
MARRYTHSGGIPRNVRWWRGTHTCATCGTAVPLEYKTDAIYPQEEARDKYLALRTAGWHARIEKTHKVTGWCSFTCSEKSYD